MELTQEQRIELREILKITKSPILTTDILKDFIEKYKISLLSITRRDKIKEFKCGYSYKEYIENSILQSKFNKNNLFLECSCGKQYVTIIFGFYKRKYKEPLCDICYKKKYMYDAEWRENNSKAQLISQNKPEVLAKQISSQKKRFESKELREKYSKIGKTLWKNLDFRNKVTANGRKLLTGKYKHLYYGSSLELAFIFWCEENKFEIKNYDLLGIDYKFDKNRTYYPDFIINNDTIVEIKGTGIAYTKTFDKTQKKFEALKLWCENNSYKFRIIFDVDIETRLKSKAKKFHHENNKKNI